MFLSFVSSRNYIKLHVFFSQSLEPATLEFTVSSSMMIDPDGVFMLEGANVHMRLMEEAGPQGQKELKGKCQKIRNQQQNRSTSQKSRNDRATVLLLRYTRLCL